MSMATKTGASCVAIIWVKVCLMYSVGYAKPLSGRESCELLPENRTLT